MVTYVISFLTSFLTQRCPWIGKQDHEHDHAIQQLQAEAVLTLKPVPKARGQLFEAAFGEPYLSHCPNTSDFEIGSVVVAGLGLLREASPGLGLEELCCVSVRQVAPALVLAVIADERS